LEGDVMVETPGSSEASARLKQTAIAQRYRDGSVLLSVSADRICRLNGVAALAWIVMEQCQQELTVEEMAQRLQERFEAINREGELLYQVTIEQLRQDIARLMDEMLRMGFLGASDITGHKVYWISSGVASTTTSRNEGLSENSTQGRTESKSFGLAENASVSADPSSRMSDGKTSDVVKVRRGEVVMALIGLAVFDLILKVFGFEALLRQVERWPTAVPPETGEARIQERVRATVDKAQMYYPKKAMCLQHSAVVTCYLRTLGVHAELILAAQEFPPRGHAWTEAAGKVVNDSPQVIEKYRELKRV
jgi:Transglutaminase-like superfamily